MVSIRSHLAKGRVAGAIQLNRRERSSDKALLLLTRQSNVPAKP